ncbi:MAG: UPF0146 family protein, partial [Halobacteriales archaeon]|nr:UPF0146 family protein [Halobacteriales archaeon]
MKSSANEALVDRFSAADTAVEVGVGHRPEVAGELAATGTRVVATDIEPRPVPAGVTFVIDDVTDPDLAVYQAASLVYALRAPPELHRAIRSVARSVDAAA